MQYKHFCGVVLCQEYASVQTIIDYMKSLLDRNATFKIEKSELLYILVCIMCFKHWFRKWIIYCLLPWAAFWRPSSRCMCSPTLWGCRLCNNDPGINTDICAISKAKSLCTLYPLRANPLPCSETIGWDGMCLNGTRKWQYETRVHVHGVFGRCTLFQMQRLVD